MMKKAVSVFLTVLVLGTICISANSVALGATGSIIKSVQSGSWSDPNTWEGAIAPGVGDDVTILSPHTIAFDISSAQLRSLTINSGGRLQGANDVDIATTLFVVVDGDILCLDGSSGSNGDNGSSGAGVTIQSAGEISISGKIIAGDGGNGGSEVVWKTDGESAAATGGNGGDGGSITITSTNSNIIVTSTAEIKTGKGGDGGDAAATGGAGTVVGMDGGDATAIGGWGGNGGDLTLLTPQGDLTVALVPGILTSNNGGAGGVSSAWGGSGGDGDEWNLPGAGGSIDSTGGKGGDSGDLTLQTLDFDGNEVIDEDEFSVLAGGAGGAAGAVDGEVGSNGADGLFQGIHIYSMLCTKGDGSDGAFDKKTGLPGGDGWQNPADGGSAVAAAGEAKGSGKGGKATATAGAGGNVIAISLSYKNVGVGWALGWNPKAGDGGSAYAVGGKGGPNGGAGGDAEAKGGKGGDGVSETIGIPTTGGHGGKATAIGGNGQKPPSCCPPKFEPAQRGLIGGKGGDADASGGNGGNANCIGGNGGDIYALGGRGGSGGDGNPPGEGGNGGGTGTSRGSGGSGSVNGLNGHVDHDEDGYSPKWGAWYCRDETSVGGVGGIIEFPQLSEAPGTSAPDSPGHDHGASPCIIAGAIAGALGLISAAWYIRRRRAKAAS